MHKWAYLGVGIFCCVDLILFKVVVGVEAKNLRVPLKIG